MSVLCLTSPDALALLEKNNLASLADYFRPLSPLTVVSQTELFVDPRLDCTDFDSLCRFHANVFQLSPHDVFSHPIATIIAISSNESDYLTTLAKLYDNLYVNYTFEHAFLDPNILKHYLVLHDPQISQVNPKSVLEQIQSSFGMNCHLLSVNSASADEYFLQSSVWESYFNTQCAPNHVGYVQPGIQYGQFIARSDLEQASRFLNEFSQQFCSPYLEKQIQIINEQVASRRGITNRLFNVGKKYFGSTNRNVSPSRSSSTDRKGWTIFHFSSPELLMLKLAAYSYLLRDYKNAFSALENIRKDFSINEKALKYTAFTQEMLGYCLLNYDLETNQISSIEEYAAGAIQGYITAGASFDAIRTAVRYYSKLKEQNRILEAPSILIRMTHETLDLQSALFLEQAALCYGDDTKSMRRKYAFHMILAGNRYNKANFRIQAHDCYSKAKQQLDHLGWDLISDHINFTMGRQQYHLGDLGATIELFSKLFHEGNQTAAQQAGYVREFVYIYKQLKEKCQGQLSPVSNLESPSIKPLSVFCGTLDDNDSSSENVVDAEIQQFLSKLRGTSVRPFVSKTEHCFSSALGDMICFHLELFNSLKIPMELYQICLRVEEEQSVGLLMDPISHLVIQPGQNQKLEINFKTQKEGHFKIVGLSFLFFGDVDCFLPFKSSFLKSGKDHISVLVTSPMPSLKLLFHDSPAELAVGEVAKFVFELQNVGGKSMEHIVAHTPVPESISIGQTPEDSFYDQFSPNQSLKVNNKITQQKMTLISSESLAVGGSLRLPIWVRVEKAGKAHLPLFFAYLSNDNRMRVLYHHLDLNVTESMRVNAFIRPSSTKIQNFILGLEIEQKMDVPVEITGLVAIGQYWNLRHIQDSVLHEPILPHQTMYSYFEFEKNDRTFSLSTSPEDHLIKTVEKIILTRDSNIRDPPSVDLRISSLFKEQPITLSHYFHHHLQQARIHWKIETLTGQYPKSDLQRLFKIFPLYFSDDVDLIVLWNIPSTHRQGHHFVMGMHMGLQVPVNLQSRFDKYLSKDLTSKKALFERTVAEQKAFLTNLLSVKQKDLSPVRLLMRCVSDVKHDFENFQDCIVPVKILLLNTSRLNVVEYLVDFNTADASKNGAQLMVHQWLGTSIMKGQLKPGEMKEITLSLLILKPGFYDINRWKLNVTLKDHEDAIGAFIQTPSIPVYIHVHGK